MKSKQVLYPVSFRSSFAAVHCRCRLECCNQLAMGRSVSSKSNKVVKGYAVKMPGSKPSKASKGVNGQLGILRLLE